MMNWSDVLMYYLLVIQILLLGYLTTRVTSFVFKLFKIKDRNEEEKAVISSDISE